MLAFARRNDAAKSKVKIRAIFIPIHILYATLLIWGCVNEFIGNCSARVYPHIFTYQYTVFYLTFIGFHVLHRTGYFMEWHESIKNLDTKTQVQPFGLSFEEKRRYRVRLIFE